MKKFWPAFAIIVMLGGVYLWPKAMRWLDEDICLDKGGVLEEGRCIQDVPFRSVI